MCETKHKHYDVIVAWAAGKKIEYLSKTDYKWRGSSQPGWYEHYEYRIKPEPKPDIVRYSGLSAWTIPDACMFQRLTDTVEYTFDGETGILKSVKKV